MGINLALVLAHSLEAADLVAFPERAGSSIRLQRAAEQLWQVMSPRWPNLNPVNEFSTFLPDERLSASEVMAAWKQGKDLPSFWWAGFHLNFGEGAVAAIHVEKLAGFVLDLDGLRSPLQECAHALASELRSPTLVYGPDSFSPFQTTLCIEDGRSLAAMLSEANRLCGPPAVTIREMADQAEELNLDRDCYFVEAVHCDEQ